MVHLSPHMTPTDPADARKKWVAWVRWYLDTHPKDVPTKTELAKRLKVVKSALTPLLDPSGTRAPSFETLVASSNLTGAPIDVMLRTEPPSGETPQRGKR
jgi:hypothetical protein